MSGCCPLSAGDDGLAEALVDEVRKARKPYRCDECFGVIAPEEWELNP